MTKKSKQLDDVPKVDPILPLPWGTQIPTVRQGDGKDILEDTRPMFVELPYRAFFQLWEHAERVAARDYPRYVGGPLDNAAQAALEAVHAFRSTAFGNGSPLPILSEEEAQRLRAKPKKRKSTHPGLLSGITPQGGDPKEQPIRRCPECASTDLKLTKKDGKPRFRCNKCGKRGARRLTLAPTSPSNGSNGDGRSSGGTDQQEATQKPKKRPKRDSKKG